ncbi:hypothetical protein HZH66_003054 [Vespula vulgaris]|uniref:Uncharacterized protein n=1 Tax=Vespula vulgaris TaxID=7454 RepID=A0A834KL50_VESVU|nr:hypothetical protein HZH66_003054 [Vespula vulgaris]
MRQKPERDPYRSRQRVFEVGRFSISRIGTPHETSVWDECLDILTDTPGTLVKVYRYGVIEFLAISPTSLIEHDVISWIYHWQDSRSLPTLDDLATSSLYPIHCPRS